MLMYDENDGYFDHVPSPVPPISVDYGQMTLADAGAAENMSSVPVGLGPRVPMLVISPWSTGGKVSSQTYDHTSVLRFLEQWLTAKGLASADANKCALISDWRRTVCGDLTEALDFSNVGKASALNTDELDRCVQGFGYTVRGQGTDPRARSAWCGFGHHVDRCAAVGSIQYVLPVRWRLLRHRGTDLVHGLKTIA